MRQGTATTRVDGSIDPAGNGAPRVPDHELLRRIGRGSYGEGVVGFGVASTLAGGIKDEDLRKQLADFERSIRSMSRPGDSADQFRHAPCGWLCDG
jgi:hypothetical protein